MLDLRVIDEGGAALGGGPLAHELAQANEALAQGRGIDAGFAFAEAARSIDLLGDDVGAHVTYQRAVRILVDAELPWADLVQVVTAWAPVALRVGGAEEVLGDLERVRAGLQRAQSTGEVRALADAEDCMARLVASQGSGAGSHDAAALAVVPREVVNAF